MHLVVHRVKPKLFSVVDQEVAGLVLLFGEESSFVLRPVDQVVGHGHIARPEFAASL